MCSSTKRINYLLFFLLPFSFFQAQENEGEDPAKIRGRIENASDSIVSVYFKPFYNYTQTKTELGEQGEFEMKTPLNGPRYLTLRHGDLSTVLFVRPGDRIRIEGDAEEGVSSFSFKEDGKALNAYLSERSSLDGSLRKQLRSSFMKDPEPFKALIDSLFEPYEELISEHRNGSSDAFYEREERRIRLKKALQRLKYETWNSYMQEAMGDSGKSTDVPKSFYSPVHKLTSYRSGDIASPTYYQFTDYYSSHLRDRMLEQDSSLKDSARIQVQLRAFEEKVKNDTGRAILLAKSTYNLLTRSGSEGARPLLNELETSGIFPDITDSLQARYEEWQTIASGKKAPGFSFPNIEGDTLSLKDLRGKYVYIDAWATWCGPCRKEIPHLKELEKEFQGKDVAFVSISLDVNEHGQREKWREMVREKELGGHQLIANGNGFQSDFAQSYLIRSIPRFILIGPDGSIIDNNAERPSGDGEEQLKEAIGEEGR